MKATKRRWPLRLAKTEKAGNGQCWQDPALAAGRCVRRCGLFGEPSGSIYHNQNAHSLYSAVLPLKTPPADSVFNALANLPALRHGCPSVNPTPDGSFQSHILGSWASFHLGSECSDFLHCDSLVSVLCLLLLIVLIDSIDSYWSAFSITCQHWCRHAHCQLLLGSLTLYLSLVG